MSDVETPIAIAALSAPARTNPTNCPEPFGSRIAGREKPPLGDLFGLSNFGANLTHLAPGSVSVLRHAHTKQDEFLYILGRAIRRSLLTKVKLLLLPVCAQDSKRAPVTATNLPTGSISMSSTSKSVTDRRRFSDVPR